MISYDTQELIDNVERICAFPLVQMAYAPADVVFFANQALKSSIVPLMMKARQDYFSTHVDVTPASNGIIPIPSQAVGTKIEYVFALSNGQFYSIPRLDLGVIASNGAPYSGVYGTANTISGSGGYFLQGNNIHLYPHTLLNTYEQNVRIHYFKRTLVLAAPADYGRIIAVNHNTNTVELDNVPTDWATDTQINVIKGSPNFDVLISSATIVSVSSPEVVLSDTTDINIGDYVCLLGYSAIPQIPVEAHDYLAHVVSFKCIQGLGDTEAMNNIKETAELLKNDLVGLIADRVEGQPQKIVNTNRFFNRGFGRFGRGW